MMDRANRIKEIIAYKQRRLDELADPNEWERITKNMECGEYKEFKQHCIDEEIIIAALREQEQSNANQRNSNASNALEWISVKERLPKVEGSYLTYTDKERIHIDSFCIYPEHGTMFWVGGNGTVTHWMPLPSTEGL